MQTTVKSRIPNMTDAGLSPTFPVMVSDEYGQQSEAHIAGERPLTLYIDGREVLTLMTLGTHPEALVLGYLRNQGFIERIEDIKAVQIAWDVDAAAVTTYKGIDNLETRLSKRTKTTGCGQGTVFGNLMDQLDHVQIKARPVHQSMLYALLDNLSRDNEIYKRAGAVHGCALCDESRLLYFVEDVGRHNAVDAIAGMMWLDDVDGSDKIFYTTGRLTSEMVIKVAQMRIPVLLSRSGVTHMGLSLAQQLGIVLIARAKGQHFLVYNGREHLVLDAQPRRPLRTSA